MHPDYLGLLLERLVLLGNLQLLVHPDYLGHLLVLLGNLSLLEHLVHPDYLEPHLVLLGNLLPLEHLALLELLGFLHFPEDLLPLELLEPLLNQ